MRLVKGGDTPADDEILLKKVFLGKKCMVYIAHFLGAKSFFSKNCHFLEKKNPGLQCDFHHMSNGNSFYGKELIKTPGIWQGGNDWQSPLP